MPEIAEQNGRDFHRDFAMIYDMYKTWEEKWQAVSSRMANLKATGCTPMADGIEFGLMQLSKRNETHRILFVITDGLPDGGHREIMKGQFRRAAEAGILVVGVGLGHEAAYVETTFPESVYAANLDALAPLLVKKLETLARRSGSKRGREVKS